MEVANLYQTLYQTELYFILDRAAKPKGTICKSMINSGLEDDRQVKILFQHTVSNLGHLKGGIINDFSCGSLLLRETKLLCNLKMR